MGQRAIAAFLTGLAVNQTLQSQSKIKPSRQRYLRTAWSNPLPTSRHGEIIRIMTRQCTIHNTLFN
ncbi:MAG: hypothetical protein AAGE59_36865 [Cyanobacteria bacterium P01_F01_bin.86]